MASFGPQIEFQYKLVLDEHSHLDVYRHPDERNPNDNNNNEVRCVIIDVDISVNRILELANSHLVRSYCLQDNRFRILAMVLKTWNKTLSNDKSLRLNSFSIYLLLLAYMLHNRYMINL